MTRYHMGINLGHERSVAIVKDSEIIVAIEQERLDRQKYSLGYLQQSPGDAAQMQLPSEAIHYCLDAAGITMADLASISGNMPGQDHAPQILRRALPPELSTKVRRIPSHHLAHAYSAYYPSGFDEALVLVVDASGSTTAEHRTESYTLYEGRSQTLSTLHSETVTDYLAGLSTLGFLYEYITRKAGFVNGISPALKHAEAGKLMGLAPFGKAQPNLHRWIHPVENSFSLQISAYDIFLEVAALEKQYDTHEGKPYLRPYLVDLAYKVQHELEQALIHIVGLAVQQTGLRKLCIAGGVGLNSVANYALLTQLGLDDIFIFPAAGDSGIAAGCALWGYYEIEGGQKRVPLKQATLGRSYSEAQTQEAAGQFGNDVIVEKLTPEAMVVRCAQALAKGSIIARFEGGSEYGPRALGHRSILADPTYRRMKDIVNARVKFREAFRPFAPVIPLESVTQVFEQPVAAPFMLLVSQIKPEFHGQIPAVTHVDGTGRVQTVTASENPFFYQLCYQLVQERQGVPVLLNTSFNVAGQPIVETPAEAIATFLKTDIDFLAIDNFWIAKRHTPVLDYEAHLKKVSDSPLPSGLPDVIPAVTPLMQQLDRALFFGETEGCPWSLEELKQLSAQGAKFKETSLHFQDSPFHAPLQTRLSEQVILLLDPLGQSTLVDLTHKLPPQSYSYAEVQLLLALLQAPADSLEQLRIDRQLTTQEFREQARSMQAQLHRYQLLPQPTPVQSSDDAFARATQTLEPFAEESFSLRQCLGQLRDRLKQLNYTADTICRLLGITAQQQIEPTRLHYYDRYRLPHNQLGDLIRLFLLRSVVPEVCLTQIFGEDLFATLRDLGVLIPRGNAWASRIDLFDVEGLYIATDHRYMILPEDKIDENPVMYVGMDSMGLVHTAPRYSVDRVLDLCCGGGIQGLIASRYAKSVASVDINPRAIRYARFNAQLNGIDNIQFHLGSLYQAVQGKFDTILANPPFVPSPTQEFRFRDGGNTGEDILSEIIRGSADHLTPKGHLFIVTDLVDVGSYADKLRRWWQGGVSDQLVLCTADRDDILFSVPHCHAAFNQTYKEYSAQLDQWICNFHRSGLTAVNFGYILIRRSLSMSSGSYYTRTIHNPDRPIHQQVAHYFQGRDRLRERNLGQYALQLSEGLNFRIETNSKTGTSKIELFSTENPYFTTYPINQMLYLLLQDIQRFRPNWSAYITPMNQACIQDLIYKGIIALIPQSTLSDPPAGINPLSIFEDPAKPVLPQPAEDVDGGSSASLEAWAIRELQTKTTPTCLSSYLG